MVIESFRSLIDELQKRAKEYEQKDDLNHSYEIKKYIKRVQEIYEKADPDIINSPIVLEALLDTIINYVDTKKTYKDFFNIDVNEDGSIKFTHYKDNENKNKFAGTRTYSKEKIGDKTYIEMSGMFGVLKDNKTSFGNTELKTQYIKSFYTLEGLEMQKAETYCSIYPQDMFTAFEPKRMIAYMDFNQPKFTEFRGFTNEMIHTNGVANCENSKLITRGKYLGDEENIGLATLSLPEGTYMKKVDLTNCGPYLDFERQPGNEIAIPNGSNNETVLNLIKEATEKYGGSQGWKTLLSALKFRPFLYSQKLRLYAENAVGINQANDNKGR